MKTITPPKSSSKKQPNNSSFARALAETEKHAIEKSQGNNSDNALLSEALARAGGSLNDKKDVLAQQEYEQKRELLRKKLHDQVNPIDQTDIFNAREKQVKKEIDLLRKELDILSQEVVNFNQEVDTTLRTRITDPGEQGKYFLNFFHHLRQVVILITQKVKSAATWAKYARQKVAKQKRRRGGLDFAGNEAKAVQDMFHHERSTAYSGG